MASCSFTHYGRTFTLTVTEKTYSIENNTSDVNWSLTITGGSSGTYYNSYAKATVNGTVVFNDTKNWDSYTFPAGNGTVSGTLYGIKHDNEGHASINFALEGYCYYYTTQYTNGSLKLTDIPRASIPTCNNATLGNKTTINTNRYVSSFTHTINIKSGSTVLETFTSVGASKDWTPAIAKYAPYITSSASGTFVIECLTYNGSTHIGTKTCNVILTVPTSVKPTASITIAEADTNMISKNWGIYVKGKSKIKVTVTGTPIYSSPIKGYSSSTNNQSNTSNTWTTNALTTVGSNSVTATVTDSRENTSNQATLAYTVVDYVKPTITTANIARCDANGIEKDDGSYLKYSFVGSISPVSNKNTKQFVLEYKLKTETTYKQGLKITDSYNIDKQNMILTGVVFSPDSSYDIKFTATDSFEPISIEHELGTGFDIINVHKSGNSLAIGKKSEASDTDKKLEIALDTEYKGNILAAFPIGAIYLSTEPTNPRNYFGGTWTQLKNAYLFATNATSGNKGTGSGTGTGTGAASGSTATTVLETKHLPSHTHTGSASTGGAHTHNVQTFPWSGSNASYYVISASGPGGNVGSTNWTGGYAAEAGSHTHTITIGSTGSGTGHSHGLNSHTHTVPYLEVYVWKRTG